MDGTGGDFRRALLVWGVPFILIVFFVLLTGMSLWHWLIVLMFIFGLMIPTSRILGRMGYPRPLCVLVIIPFVNSIGLWLLAYARWPNAGYPSASVQGAAEDEQ